MFPAASLARMVIRFVPTSSGISGVAHCVVPVAAPDTPVELLHVTLVTATLSDAVPENTMLAAVVDTFVLEGELTLNEGAVVSLPAGTTAE